MDQEDFGLLLSPTGQEALAAAEAMQPKEADFLALFDRLAKRYPAILARAALETAILRLEALKKFPFAGLLYTTRIALEQATAYEVSTYRSQRYAGCNKIFDLGCSMGGDTIALSDQAPTIGIDLDPLRLRMAAANLSALGKGPQVHFIQADLRAKLPLAVEQGAGLFFDPARRLEGQRVFSVRNYSPPLDILHRWLEDFNAIGVKISPGVKIEELTFRKNDLEIEFISWRGELKEAALWFRDFRKAARRAAVLPGAHILESRVPFEEWSLRQGRLLAVRPPQAYLYEPDPAVIRAGLVEDLGLELNLCQIDADIAYLTGSQHTPTPFARVWEVEDWMPFNLKDLRSALRERGVGKVTVKKRGSPLQPEELIHNLKLKGEQERTLFMTHYAGQPVVILSREVK